MDRLLAVARRPWPDRLDVDAPDDERMAALSRRRLATVTAAYWIERTRYSQKARSQLAAKTLALVRSAAAAVAIERFRRAHGTLPPALEDLVPSALASVPVDPYSGLPLRYRASGEAYAIYSVGENGVDDGGTDLGGRAGRRAYSPTDPSADVGVAVRLGAPGAR
jgi:hypothetical protein